MIPPSKKPLVATSNPPSPMTPVPLIVSTEFGLTVTPLGLTNVMPLTSVSSDIEGPMLERANVATSAGPLGTVAGVQFSAVFQSPDVGLRFHWALPAYVTTGKTNNRRQRSAATTWVFIEVISG